MLKYLNPFRLPTAEEVRQQQLANAERLMLTHQASAEEQQAMADMYRDRVRRLTAATHPAVSDIDETLNFPAAGTLVRAA